MRDRIDRIMLTNYSQGNATLSDAEADDIEWLAMALCDPTETDLQTRAEDAVALACERRGWGLPEQMNVTVIVSKGAKK